MTRTILARALPLLLLAAAVYAWHRSAWPGMLAPLRGKLLGQPVGGGDWVAWLEGDQDEARLVARPGHRSPRPVLVAPGLSGLSVAGSSAFVTRALGAGGDPTSADLLRVDLAKGTSEVIAQLACPAAEIVSGDGWLCWLENRRSAVPGAPFLVAAEPVSVIRAMEAGGGQLHTMAVLSTGVGDSQLAVSLLGVAEGRPVWVERHPSSGRGWTIIRRGASGEPPRTLVREEGRQQAALSGDTLIWTAPSRESAEPHAFAAAKRSFLDGANAEVIGDWLDTKGKLLLSDGRSYFQEPQRLWRLGSGTGSGRDEQRVERIEPRTVLAASVLGEEEYLLLWRGRSHVIASRPLTLWARLRALASL